MKKLPLALLSLSLQGAAGCSIDSSEDSSAGGGIAAECVVTPDQTDAIETHNLEEVLSYCDEFNDEYVTCLLNAYEANQNLTVVWDAPCDAETLEQDLQEIIFDYDDMPAEKTCWTGGATIECE